MRAVAFWISAWVALAAVLALASAAFGVALIAAPVLFLAGRWLAQRQERTAARARRAGPAVYEGEFRVLDETVDERP